MASVTLEAAFKAHTDGNLDKAIHLYRKVAKEDPELPMAQRFLGSALAQTGQTQEALAVWMPLLQCPEHQRDVSFLRDVARAGFETFSREALLTVLRSCSNEISPDFEALGAAVGLLLKDDPPEQRNASSLSEDNPSIIDELENIGGVDGLRSVFLSGASLGMKVLAAQRLLARERFCEVTALMEQTNLNTEPSLGFLYLKALNRLAAHEKINGFCAEHRHLFLGHPDWAYEYLLSLEMQGKVDDALTFISSLTPKVSMALAGDPDFLNLKGLLLKQAEQCQEAAEVFTTAMEIYQDHADSRINLKTLYLGQRRFLEALALDDAYCSSQETYDLFFSKCEQGLGFLEGPIVLDEGLGEQILYRVIMNEFFAQHTNKIRFICNPRIEPLFGGVTPVQAGTKEGALRGGTIAIGLLKLMLELKICKREEKAFAAGGKYIGLSWKSQNPYIGSSKSIDFSLLVDEMVKFGCHQFALLQPLSRDEKRCLEERGVDNYIYDPSLETDSLLTIRNIARACDQVITISNTVAHVCGMSGVSTTLIQRPGRARLWFWDGLRSAQTNRHMVYKGVRILDRHPSSHEAFFIKHALEHDD